MSFRSTLTTDMKNAMRARDQLRLDAIRFVLSLMKNAEIDLKREMTDAEIQTLIQKEVKNRQEAIQQYRDAGRDDIVDEEVLKVEVLQEYLPQQMSDDDLRAVVQKHIDLSQEKHMGKIIGAVMADVSGKADGGRVSSMVKTLLAQ